MKRSIASSRIEGEVQAPPSKSLMLRAVAAAVLTEGRAVTITNPSACDDAEAALGIAEGLGAAVRREAGRVVIEAGARPAARVLQCGESGLALRLFPAVAALRPGEFVFEGRGSLLRRPVGMLEAPLRALGAACETRGGFAPVTVRGPLRGGRAVVDGGLSSQALTGLLLALPRAAGDSELVVPEIKSRAYVEMTLEFLGRAGIEVSGGVPGVLRIPGGQSYAPTHYAVEGDWSGAAFLLVAGALAGEITVRGLDVRSLQADRAVCEALERCGADLTVADSGVSSRRRDLRAFAMDLADAPDLFPPLTALACFCEGTTRLEGVDRLRHKESDRAAALERELGRLGADLRVEGNALVVRGGPLGGGTASSRGDHRIAMALAVAGLRAGADVVVEDAQCVDKSYPRFFEDLAAVGGRIHE
jgi:3-phosphoshikimate 1-carboxyvinyltransferase